jgi:hypothetical protein
LAYHEFHKPRIEVRAANTSGRSPPMCETDRALDRLVAALSLLMIRASFAPVAREKGLSEGAIENLIIRGLRRHRRGIIRRLERLGGVRLPRRMQQPRRTRSHARRARSSRRRRPGTRAGPARPGSGAADDAPGDAAELVGAPGPLRRHPHVGFVASAALAVLLRRSQRGHVRSQGNRS